MTSKEHIVSKLKYILTCLVKYFIKIFIKTMKNKMFHTCYKSILLTAYDILANMT